MRPLSERWQRWFETPPGAEDRPPHDYRLFLAGQMLFGVALVLHVLFIPLFVGLGVSSLALFNVLSVLTYALCLWLNRRGRSGAALWFAFAEVHLHALLAVVLVGWDTGFGYYLLATGPMLFLHTGWSMTKKVLAVLVPVALLAGLHDYSLAHAPLHTINAAAKLTLYDFNLLATLAVLSYLAHFYSKGAHRSEAQLRAVSRSLEEQAATDPLTGLLNRRAMIREIENEISRFERQPRGFVLAIGDLDGFKEVNDRYGHDAGDLVLNRVATIMTEFLRSHDVTSRWGGEEFVILLPDTDIDGGLDTVDRLRERLAQSDIVFQGEALGVSITFGLCAYEAGMSRDTCLKRADEALYRGKQMGRNRVVVA
ncbi:MAG: GGDEF domain-containing protein [Gammaproteobacteria bacterium]